MKTRFFTLATLCIATILFSAKIKAYDFEVDGIYYNILSISDKTCEVTYKSSSYNSYSGNIIIPSHVTYNTQQVTVIGISKYAFKNCTLLDSITIPSTIKSIGYSAFYDCRKLKQITIPKSVTSINGAFFQLCLNLQEIIFPEGSIFKWVNNCVVDTTTNTVIAGYYKSTIPTDAKFIGNSAFYESELSGTITIPGTIIKVAGGAFYSCKNITKFVFEESDYPIYIAGIAGEESKIKLQDLYIGRDISGTNAFEKSPLKTVTFGPKARTIPSATFKCCNNLKSVNIEGVIKSMGSYAFFQCFSLEDIDFTKLEPLYIGDAMFGECNKIKDVRFSDNTTIRGFDAYVTNMYISNKTKIESNTALRFGKVTNLTLEDSDKELNLCDIGFVNLYMGRPTTFTYTYYCENYVGMTKSIEFGDNIKVCNTDFSTFTNIRSIIFGKNFEKLSTGSFIKSTKITSIISKNLTPPSNMEFDDNVFLNAVVKVPTGALEAYIKDPTWSKFWNISEDSSLSNTDIYSADIPSIVNVYNLQGAIVRKGVLNTEATMGLPKGLYIIDGKKVLVN